MAKRNPVIAFDAKMYKHFAVVTLALTACVAVFADGEKRETVTETAIAAAKYEPKKPVGAQLIIKNANVGSGRNLDGFYGGGGGGSELGSQSNVNSSLVRGELTTADLGGRVDERRLAQLGLTMEQFSSLGPKEQQEVITMLNNGVSATDLEQGIRDATRGSLSRSGITQSADF